MEERSSGEPASSSARSRACASSPPRSLARRSEAVSGAFLASALSPSLVASVVEALPVAVIVLDADERVLLWSAGAESLLGW
ncbi:MAG: hypothetical protein C4321_10290, partial [Chloroflexota bacterium]